MKRISLSWLHVVIAIVTFMFTFAKGQDHRYIPVPDPILIQEQHNLAERPEIIAYQLVPGKDNYCHFEIQIVEGFGWNDIPDYQREETKEIIIDRIVFEEINPWAVNDMFYIDEKPYYLLRIPFQGWEW